MPTKKKAAAKRAPRKAPAKAKSATPQDRKVKRLKAAGPPVTGKARILRSKVVYKGKLFRVTQDRLVEPGGNQNIRDVVRHNGSAVILAVDPSKNKKDPWIVMERQYRHAAGQFLWELPAGRLDPGEDPIAGAKRELEEETGYRAKKWSPLLEYFASPGFLAESMQVFLAEGLIAGDAHPEEDENIEIRLVKLSEILKAIDKGNILDGKTIACILVFERLRRK